jgi:hypothetical protein
VSKTFDQTLIEGYESELSAAEAARGQLAADLLEERAQRREVGEALVRVTEERDELARTLELEREHHKGVREYAVARQAERDEARDEVVRLGRERDTWKTYATKRDVELERLRTTIVELGAGEAAEPLDASITPSLPARGYDPERDQLFVMGNFDLLRAEPEEQIEALRPGDAGFDEWLLGQPGGSE